MISLPNHCIVAFYALSFCGKRLTSQGTIDHERRAHYYWESVRLKLNSLNARRKTVGNCNNVFPLHTLALHDNDSLRMNLRGHKQFCTAFRVSFPPQIMPHGNRTTTKKQQCWQCPRSIRRSITQERIVPPQSPARFLLHCAARTACHATARAATESCPRRRHDVCTDRKAAVGLRTEACCRRNTITSEWTPRGMQRYCSRACCDHANPHI